jgi:hypothetical protein
LKEIRDAVAMLLDPPQPDQGDLAPGGPGFQVVSRTRIGQYVGR